MTPSPIRRLALLCTGHAFVGIAVVGVFLPIIPTTGPLLVAAACYARASNRFYNWLLNNKTFGPIIIDWRRHRAIALRTKVVAIVLIVITIGSSIIFFTELLALRISLAAIGVGVITFLLRAPTRRTGSSNR